MIQETNSETIAAIRNPKLKAYAQIYARIYDRFVESLKATGLDLDDRDDRTEYQASLSTLARKGAIVRNDGKSVYVNRLSTSCAACQTGLGTATFFVSLKCHRSCFFCFNPNQQDYDFYTTNTRDCLAELDEIASGGARLDHIGLTGGEPLLFKKETIAFFRSAAIKFPHAHTRLYTSGDFLDHETLQALHSAQLKEIRFSVRLLDSEPARRHTFEQIALAKAHIPNVMVEMPVLPGRLAEMQSVLDELDRLNVFGINLLEFCFPLSNAETFRDRGYKIKQRPYRVLYNYGYAGGLPIAGSEMDCLALVEYALDNNLRLGVHYCSLENKHSGEIYQHHYERQIDDRLYWSPRDYFLKSAKVFGKDIARAIAAFDAIDYKGYVVNREHHYCEFHVDKIKALGDPDVEVALSTSVMEDRPDGEYLREVQIDLTTPRTFDFDMDV